MLDTAKKLLKWIDWGYVVIALALILLGYVIGIVGSGAEIKLSEWVTAFSSLAVAIIAMQGLSAYKKQHRYLRATSAAESILKSKALFKVQELSRKFELVCYAAIQITENRGTRYQVSNENAHKLLNDIHGYLDQIKKLIEEIDEISVTNIMFMYENIDTYNDISELLESIHTFSEKMERYFGQSRSLKDDPNDRFNITITENLANEFEGALVGNTVDKFAEIMKISYPISNKSGRQLFQLSKRLEPDSIWLTN